ncbi:MAG: hypothetical protein JWM31_750 [Solirubrobacterales bacterium]|nr:hypothetical protein [Solirubrobacterales bacterium]
MAFTTARDPGKAFTKLEAEHLRLEAMVQEAAAEAFKAGRDLGEIPTRLQAAHARAARGLEGESPDQVAADRGRLAQLQQGAADRRAGYQQAAQQVAQQVAAYRVTHLDYFVQEAHQLSVQADAAYGRLLVALAEAAACWNEAASAWTDVYPAARAEGIDLGHLRVNPFVELEPAVAGVANVRPRPPGVDDDGELLNRTG